MTTVSGRWVNVGPSEGHVPVADSHGQPYQLERQLQALVGWDEAEPLVEAVSVDAGGGRPVPR